MNPLDLVRLTALMGQTQGRPEIDIGLIDGPVFLDHPDLAAGRIRAVPGRLAGACARSRRTSVAPPLLDAWSAYQTVLSIEKKKEAAISSDEDAGTAEAALTRRLAFSGRRGSMR